MTELLHTILLRVTLAGIASAAALKLSGEGAMKEAVKLSAGLLMLLALLQPLAGIKGGFPEMLEAGGVPVTELEEENMQTVMSTVAASIAESVESRALREGIKCDVVVTMGKDSNGLLQISHVTVYYREQDSGRIEIIKNLLLEECGVEEGRQELIER